MQLYFAVLNTGSIIAKGLPDVGVAALLGALGVGLGLAVGHLAARRVSPEHAQSAVLVLALAGAAGKAAKG